MGKVTMTFTDSISAVGVFFILLAFFLNTIGRLRSDTFLYFSFNLVGSALAFWGSVLLKSIPFAVLEGLWFILALAGLIRTLRRVNCYFPFTANCSKTNTSDNQNHSNFS
jgi:hypothetical protein